MLIIYCIPLFLAGFFACVLTLLEEKSKKEFKEGIDLINKIHEEKNIAFINKLNKLNKEQF